MTHFIQLVSTFIVPTFTTTLLFLVTVTFTCWTSLSLAAVDPMDFSSAPHLEARYQELTASLRCPKCQNQSIGGSDAQISQDMRQRVYKMLLAGQTNEAIEAYMIERYGEFVTYDPPVNPRNYLLWFGPFIFMLILIIGFVLVRRSGPKISQEDTL